MKENLKQLIRTFHNSSIEYKSRIIVITINLNKIITIIGSRRVGKTFVCYQIISELVSKHNVLKENILYINFEDEEETEQHLDKKIKIMPIWRWLLEQ